MTYKFNIIQDIKTGSNIFVKEWKLLISTIVVFFIPLLIYSIGNDYLWTSIKVILFLLTSLLSPALLILITKLTENNYKKNKRYSLKEFLKDLKNKYFDTLLTIILMGLILLAIGIVLLIIFFIIGAILSIFIKIPTSIEEFLTSPWVLISFLYVLIGFFTFLIAYSSIFFTTTITIVTKKKYLEAMRASFRIVKKKLWYFLGTIVIFETIISIIQLIVKTIFGILSKDPSSILGFLQTVVIQIAILPISIAIIIWYFSIDKKPLRKKVKVKTK